MRHLRCAVRKVLAAAAVPRVSVSTDRHIGADGFMSDLGAARAAAELQKLEAETAKLRAEAEAQSENARKTRSELVQARETRRLEWVKSIGAGVAALAGLAALLTFGGSWLNAVYQRQDDAAKRRDADFASAVERLSAADPTTRLSAVVSITRYLQPGYEDYWSRALPAATARLRFEPDPGIRRLIVDTARRQGPAGRTALFDVRSDARLGVLDLLRSAKPDDTPRKEILQLAFFDASRGIAAMDNRPLDLSGGPFDDFNLPERNLVKVNLDGASLRSADLSGFDLSDASLRNSVLRRVVFRQANLTRADLDQSDLTCANLAGAQLLDVKNLQPAQLAYSNWREAAFDDAQRRALDRVYPSHEGTAAERERLCRNVVR